MKWKEEWKPFRNALGKLERKKHLTEMKNNKDKSETEGKLVNISTEIWDFLEAYQEVIPKIFQDWETVREISSATGGYIYGEAARRYLNQLRAAEKLADTRDQLGEELRGIESHIKDDFRKGTVTEPEYDVIIKTVDTLWKEFKDKK